MSNTNLAGKIAYGVVFMLGVPFLLVWWASCTSPLITLPVPGSPWLAYPVLLAGLAIMSMAMWQLWRYGKGLPMNAYPPAYFVSRGLYRYMAHPIYAGAILTVIGAAMLWQSPGGFWLVSPIFALGCTALVLGFEKQHIRQFFGEQEHPIAIAIPVATEEAPSIADRISVYVLVLLPWLLLYELKVFIGVPENPVDTHFAFEQRLPVINWSAMFYILIYPLVVLFPLLAVTKKRLHSFSRLSLFATGLGMFLLYLLPVISIARINDTGDCWSRLLRWERDHDSIAAAFPSFHVVWALIIGREYGQNFLRLKWIFYLLSFLVIVSCITTGVHSLADLAMGIVVFVSAFFRSQLWSWSRDGAQYFANSWKEWRIGPLRIINHALYPGIAAFTGILIVYSFVPCMNAIIVLLVCSLVCAALWGQLIEGSPALLRPFGYYGSVIGGAIGVVIAHYLYNLDAMLLMAALSVAAPWVQAIGRLRCWVQGCCHGKPCPERIGIKYYHPKSRVSLISGYQHIPLHNTQLYSIVTNIFTGIILLKLVSVSASWNMIIGLALILNGLGRFVEEAYRGETQTRIIFKLRLYQWLALFSMLAGVIVSTMPAGGSLALVIPSGAEVLPGALGGGLLAAFAMGMDFPAGRFRFSRLSG